MAKWCGWIVVTLGVTAPVFGAGTNDVVWSASGGNGSGIAGSVVRMLGSMVLVLGLLVVAVRGLKHWRGLGGLGKKEPHIRVIETRSLAQRQTLYLVTCDGQRMLLAGSAAGVSFLTPLAPQLDESPEEGGPSSTVVHFAEALTHALGRKS
jgi:flagellar biogenesis protein FliO